MKNKKQKFRASFTILNLWKSGKWEDAIKQYFKMETLVTRAMVEGRDFHKDWENEIKKTGCLPEVFGSTKLKNPTPEKKIVKQLDDWLEIVGIIDCIDDPVLYEFKSGVTTAQQYANGMQVGIYAFIATLDGHLIEKAEIHHYNQHNKKSDMAIVWITDKVLRDAGEWITTLSSEMHSYMIANDLYNKLGKENAGNK